MRCYPGIGVLIFFVLLGTACTSVVEVPAPSAVGATTTEADVDAVKRVREQAIAAINAGDLDAVAALLTDDIVWMPQEKPTSIGKEAFRLYWVALFEQFVFDRTLTHDEVIVAGDWAIHRSTLGGTVTPKAGGESLPLSSKAIDILRRQPDGSWKHARVIFNSNSQNVAAHPNLK